MASIGGSNNDLGFQSSGKSGIICPSSGMTTNPYFASAWDPVVSLSLQESFGGSSLVSQTDFGNSPYPDAVQKHGISCSSRLVHYPSDSSFVQLPKLPCFGSGSFAELVGPFGQNESGHTLNEEGGNRSIQNVAQSHEDHQVSEDTVTGASPTGRRRKRGPEYDSHFRSTNAVGGLQKDTSKESSDTPDKQDEKKLKTQQNAGVNLRGKQVAKQAKDSSQGGEPPKDNYIHVRARRGQATNSHSLAERVRREKISERMKTLQELVPGCNKITGKAVMLDEIINYVQSLQQQVEFLSMKLATVYPELNIDIERILSKDIIYSRCGNAAALGFNPEMNSHSPSNGMYSAGMPLVPNTNLLFPPMTQPILDNEVQSFLQMGLDSNSAMNSLACNGNWTLETRALKSRRGLLTTNSSNRS